MDAEPKDVIILSAISKGAKKFDKIAKTTKIVDQELNELLKKLEEKGFITVVEKKGFFSTKKEIALTAKGQKEFEERKFELQKDWEQMVTIWKGGDKQKLQQYLDNKKPILPSMMFLGIMDMMMFATMMSFMSMSLSSYVPDAQMPADASTDTGTSADTGDSGADMGGDGGGGFDIDIGF